MKKELRIKMANIFGSEDDATFGQLIEILNLPNKQFDALYPSLKSKLKEVYSSKTFQKEVLANFEIIPLEDREEMQTETELLLKEIESDDTLSKNKKEMIRTLIQQTVVEIYKLYENPREKIKVKIHKLNPDAIIPQYAHDSDAGADVCALEETTIEPGQTVIVKTGLQLAIPKGYEIQVRPRSGLSVKTKLRIANAPGTIKVA